MPAAQMKISINPEQCRGCGTCVRASRDNVVKLEDYKARVQGGGYTRQHDILVAGCPAGAISIDDTAAPILEPFFRTHPDVIWTALSQYFGKMKGVSQSPPGVDGFEILCSWIGAFAGIAAVAYINFALLAGTDMMLLIGSFGASAVLIYGAVKSPLAQPRNLIGGHVISAVIGVACRQLFTTSPWLAAAAAVATAIAAMHATRTLHPPGGATALIAVIGGANIRSLGYLYAVIPVGAGAAVMLLIALIVNNIPAERRYPQFWL